jgi:hypothetical protein
MRDARLVCGMDLRRMAPTAEDTMRVDGFVARHGGVLSVSAVGDVTLAMTWDGPDGARATITAPTISAGLQALADRMAV